MNLISIGRFSRLTGLSIRALRLYNTEGILEPSHIDPDTGYRYYTLDQVDLAERIKLLRECEMPLEQILALLRHPKETNHRLLEHRAFIKHRISQHQQMLIKLDTLIDNNRQPLEVIYKKLPEQSVFCVSEQVIWAEQSHHATIGRALGYIYDLMRSLQLRIIGSPFCMYPLPWRKKLIDVQVCIPITTLESTHQEVQFKVCPAVECATAIHYGEYANTIQTVERLMAQVNLEGYEVGGLIRETYLEHPLSVQDPSQYRTEIAITMLR